MSVIELFEQRRLECERQLHFAETQPGFRLWRETRDDGQIDVTEQHKLCLRRAIDVYQLTIEYLKRRIAE